MTSIRAAESSRDAQLPSSSWSTVDEKQPASRTRTAFCVLAVFVVTAATYAYAAATTASPLPYAPQAPYTSPTPKTPPLVAWSHCANECRELNGSATLRTLKKRNCICECAAGTTRFGAQSTWRLKTGTQACTISNFGGPLPNTRRTCQCGIKAVLPSRILVHTHYYERRSMPQRERQNKRTNLAMFIEHAVVRSGNSTGVFFHITWNGDPLPSLAELYGDIYGNSTSRLPKDRTALFPVRDNVLVEGIPPSSTDLCPRAHAIRRARKARPAFTHVLFLNDGSRGPFTTVDPRSELGWLTPFTSPIEAHPDVGAVGVMMACHVGVHLQSWAVLLDWRLHGLFLANYEYSCDERKTDAIIHAEVTPYRWIAKRGFGLAGIFPRVPYVPASDVLRVPAALESNLEWCNPIEETLRRDSFDTPIEEIGFVKFGGEPWRLGEYSDSYVNRVVDATRRTIGTSCCKAPLGSVGARAFITTTRREREIRRRKLLRWARAIRRAFFVRASGFAPRPLLWLVLILAAVLLVTLTHCLRACLLPTPHPPGPSHRRHSSDAEEQLLAHEYRGRRPELMSIG